MRPVLTHLALHVRDLGATIAFYQEVCGLRLAHDRIDPATGARVVWLAEPGREQELVLVLIPGGPGRDQAPGDFSHLGFALASRAEVDAVAERARAAGRLAWPPREEAWPVGYYCGVRAVLLGRLRPERRPGPAAPPTWRGRRLVLRWHGVRRGGTPGARPSADGGVVEFSFGQPLGPGSAAPGA